MVRFSASLILLIAASLAVAPAQTTSPRPLPPYEIGDVVAEDVVTPFRLTVVDEATTQALREREISRIQVIVSYDANVARESESNLLADFELMKVRFLEAHQLRPPEPPPTGTTQFLQFWRVFCKERPEYPLSSNLAAIWVDGLPDDPIRTTWRVQLRSALGRYIRADGAPGGIHLGRWVRMIPRARPEDMPTADIVEQLGTSIPQTNIPTLSRVTNELLRAMEPEQRQLARYLASLIQPNCAIEVELTKAVRARRTELLTAADVFEPGQIVAQQGQIVDAKLKPALDQLREKLVPTQLQQQLAATRAEVAAASQYGEGLARNIRWLWFGLLALCLVAAGLLGVALLRRRRVAQLPAQVRATFGETGDPESVAAKLAELLKDMLVQRMIEQRLSLLEAQQKAAQEVAELEARLEKLHTPLQERLTAYEQRIAELEQELAARNLENKILLESHIAGMKEQTQNPEGKEYLRRN